MTPHTIAPALTAADLDAVRILFREYVDSLGIDLAYQGFEAELARLPDKYRRPRGELLLARANGELLLARAHGELLLARAPDGSATGTPLGCVGLRPLDIEGACEIKRLYVRDAARGTGLGRALIAEAIAVAAATGYRRVLLDTLPVMTQAIALYRSLGFQPIPPYWDNQVPDILYFSLTLSSR